MIPIELDIILSAAEAINAERWRAFELAFGGIEVYENQWVPYKPGRGWMPVGRNAIAMHPDAIRDLKAKIAGGDKA